MKSLCDFVYKHAAEQNAYRLRRLQFIMEEGRMICSFQKDWTDLEMKFLRL